MSKPLLKGKHRWEKNTVAEHNARAPLHVEFHHMWQNKFTQKIQRFPCFAVPKLETVHSQKNQTRWTRKSKFLMGLHWEIYCLFKIIDNIKQSALKKRFVFSFSTRPNLTFLHEVTSATTASQRLTRAWLIVSPRGFGLVTDHWTTRNFHSCNIVLWQYWILFWLQWPLRWQALQYHVFMLQWSVREPWTQTRLASRAYVALGHVLHVVPQDCFHIL